ncbi:MAG: hypothetical protein MUE36_08685 [Acidimicrobiales bacterium]|jgi:hypothetical protein|nr:hypothetical protein [Acidimicrobiales bacterium]
MADNKLDPGAPRLGWLVDGDPTTPEVAVLLHDNGANIRLTIPWPDGWGDSPYRKWFDSIGQSRRADEADTSGVPSGLLFHDVDGPVSLVGCRAVSTRATAPGSGEGVVDVRFALLGGRENYEKINGLRSEMPGLGDWIGLRSITEAPTRDDQSRLRSLDLHLESPGPIALDRSLNLRLRPNFRYGLGSEPDTRVLKEAIEIETLVTKARSWGEHIANHEAVRQLLCLSAGRTLGYGQQWANRASDPERTMSGRVVCPRWAEVRSYELRKADTSTTRPHFLFGFSEIGVRGFKRWLRVRSDFERGVLPLTDLLEQRRTPIETVVAQAGIGFEALGYAIALESGVSRGSAKAESHEARLERIFTQIPDVLPEDCANWVQRSVATYNGVKHANRPQPSLIELADTQRLNLLIFRLWVAARIGVQPSSLAAHLRTDPMARPLVPL